MSLLKDEDDSRTGFVAGLDKERQLSELIAKRLKIIEEARWKFDVGNQTIEVKAQADRIVKTVVFAKDFVSSAVSSDPHAALAWAGVCVLMPVSITSFSVQLLWVQTTSCWARGTQFSSTLQLYLAEIETYSAHGMKITKYGLRSLWPRYFLARFRKEDFASSL